MSRVVIVTPEPVGERMAGPAIRVWNMATVLADDGHDVRLLSTVSVGASSPIFDVLLAASDSLAEHARWADVVVLHPGILRTHADVGDTGAAVVVDIYDPFHLENLEPSSTPIAVRAEAVTHLTGVLNDALRRGDFFLCASERQRDFWLGSLASLGRINPENYDADPTMASFVAVAPFGIAEEPPVHGRAVLRGVVDGIGDDDRILLWAGGVYDWLDPVILVDAVDLARTRVPTVRLVFLGMTHPNPHLPPMQAARDIRARADELGLTGRHVFFNEGWIPYEERADYLLEADVGVSTHRRHLETAYAFRTRVLDYLWAGLPILTSDGDVLADLTAGRDLGRVVPAGDVPQLAEAIVELLSSDERLDACGARAREVAQEFAWSRVLQPLVDFCRAPRPAADRRSPTTTATAPATATGPDDEDHRRGGSATLDRIKRFLRSPPGDG